MKSCYLWQCGWTWRILCFFFFFFFLTERHPISNAIDGTNNWWQSPSIQNGREYHWVTITLDLRQVGKARSTEEFLWVAELQSDDLWESLPCFLLCLHSVLIVSPPGEVQQYTELVHGNLVWHNSRILRILWENEWNGFHGVWCS